MTRKAEKTKNRSKKPTIPAGDIENFETTDLSEGIDRSQEEEEITNIPLSETVDERDTTVEETTDNEILEPDFKPAPAEEELEDEAPTFKSSATDNSAPAEDKDDGGDKFTDLGKTTNLDSGIAKKQQENFANYLTDRIVKYVPQGFRAIAKVNERKWYRKHLEGKIDLDMRFGAQVENEKQELVEVVKTGAEILHEYNKTVEEQFGFDEKTKEDLLRVANDLTAKHEWGMSPEVEGGLILGEYFVNSLATAIGLKIYIKQFINEMVISTLENQQKGKSNKKKEPETPNPEKTDFEASAPSPDMTSNKPVTEPPAPAAGKTKPASNPKKAAVGSKTAVRQPDSAAKPAKKKDEGDA